MRGGSSTCLLTGQPRKYQPPTAGSMESFWAVSLSVVRTLRAHSEDSAVLEQLADGANASPGLGISLRSARQWVM